MIFISFATLRGHMSKGLNLNLAFFIVNTVHGHRVNSIYYFECSGHVLIIALVTVAKSYDKFDMRSPFLASALPFRQLIKVNLKFTEDKKGIRMMLNYCNIISSASDEKLDFGRRLEATSKIHHHV